MEIAAQTILKSDLSNPHNRIFGLALACLFCQIFKLSWEFENFKNEYDAVFKLLKSSRIKKIAQEIYEMNFDKNNPDILSSDLSVFQVSKLIEKNQIKCNTSQKFRSCQEKKIEDIPLQLESFLKQL